MNRRATYVRPDYGPAGTGAPVLAAFVAVVFLVAVAAALVLIAVVTS